MPVPRHPYTSARNRAVAPDARSQQAAHATLTAHIQKQGLAILAADVCIKEKPVLRLADMLNALPVRELREELEAFHIADGLKGVKKADLVAFLCALFASPEHDYPSFAAGYGPKFVAGLKRVGTQAQDH